MTIKERRPIKRKPTRKERCTSPEVYEEACLLSGGRWVRGPGRIGGQCFGGKCPICNGKKTDPRGLKFIHKKRRKMGGTTSPEIHSIENLVWGCYVCDEINDGVILPRSQPVGKPAFHMAGYNVTLRAFPKSEQTGIKVKEK